MQLLVLCACTAPTAYSPSHHVPLLSEQSSTADAELDQVARIDALSGALEYDLAPLGEAWTPSEDGEAMAYDDATLQSAEDGAGGSLPSEYEHVLRAATAVIAADAVGTVVIGVPAAAVAIAQRGTVTSYGDNAWVAMNTVSDGNRSVTGAWGVAWVGVGWLAEMRLWSSDGQYSGQTWFNGFVSADQGLGWWDIYDVNGTQAGVVEWLGDGAGNGEVGIAALSGENAGDVLAWLNAVEGDNSVVYYDSSLDETGWVTVRPDRSGEVRLVDYNYGERGCWDSARRDVECPAD